MLSKKLDFDRKSYGPGDDVMAKCMVSRSEGGTTVANQVVEATVWIDGKGYGPDGKVNPQPLCLLFNTDDKGKVDVRFKLPAEIEKGVGSLSLQFTDGANHETMVRTIPIVLKKLQVELYPEGGDLVAGVPNRVYFQVRTTLDKPADLKGRLVDVGQVSNLPPQEGKVVVDAIHTLTDADNPGVNQGMGVFELTPQVGHKYELKIDSPAGGQAECKWPSKDGKDGVAAWPEIKEDGVVLSVPDGVTGAGDSLRVRVCSPHAERTLLVGDYCRGQLITHRSVKVQKDELAEVVLKPDQPVGGVYRITVFEQRPGVGQAARLPETERQAGSLSPVLVPVAERLVYRQPAKELKLTVEADKKTYAPGSRAELVVKATDEKGKATPAIMLLAVVDKGVITLADEKTFRGMPTHFYLTSEVRRSEDLEYADFLVSARPGENGP